jgi:hypothetical protein
VAQSSTALRNSGSSRTGSVSAGPEPIPVMYARADRIRLWPVGVPRQPERVEAALGQAVNAVVATITTCRPA